MVLFWLFCGFWFGVCFALFLGLDGFVFGLCLVIYLKLGFLVSFCSLLC